MIIRAGRDAYTIMPGLSVLDAGSGNRPDPAATVLFDKYIDDNSHRFSDPEVENAGLVMDGRKFVEGDLCDMPFADGEFDFIICSNVLEHVDDPVKAVAEIQRVAKSGYLEVPSALHEVLYVCPDHKWIFGMFGDTLVYAEHAQEWLWPREYPWGLYNIYPISIMKQLFFDQLFIGLWWDSGSLEIRRGGG